MMPRKLPTTTIRLNKLAAQVFGCSRREAIRLIQNSDVQVDGHVIIQPGTRVAPTASVHLRPSARRALDQAPTLILNKPLGYVSCQPESHQIPAARLLTHDNLYGRAPPTALPRKLGVVGRLDVNSSGLLMFTASGKVASQVVGESSTVEKEYLVRVPPVDSAVATERIQSLLHGVQEGGELLEAVNVELLDENLLRMTLTRGRKHHIRRMLRVLHWPVRALKRVRIGNIRLGGLPVGKWRYLGFNESISS